IAAISCRTILASSPSRPPPPYSVGQCGTVQPLSRIRSNQARCGSEENFVLRPPQKVSSSAATGLRISGGQLASSQARVSRRKVSRSAMGHVSTVKIVELTLACGARISICLWPAHAAPVVASARIPVYGFEGLETQRKTAMRLKLLSPDDMNDD